MTVNTADAAAAAPNTPAAPQTFTIPNPAPPAVNLQDPAVIAAIEAARKQEKDKLYAEIEALKPFRSQVEEVQKSLAQIQAEKDAEIKAAAEQARKEAEEAARKQWEENDAKTLLEKAQQDWESKFQQMRQEQEQERATFEKEKSFLELQSYTQAKVSEAVTNGVIAPELAHLVTGNNQAEIDASLESIKATSEAIAQNIAQAQQAAQAQKRGVSPTGYAPVGPMDMAAGQRTLSAEDISNMSMAEYAKIRSALPGVNQVQTNRGLFG